MSLQSGLVLDEQVVRRMMGAFEKRCQKLYGSASAQQQQQQQPQQQKQQQQQAGQNTNTEKQAKAMGVVFYP